MARDTIVASYLHNASDHIRLVDLGGNARGEVELPELGSLTSLDAQPDAPDLLLTFTSFTHPPTSYRCELTTGVLEPFGIAGVAGAGRTPAATGGLSHQTRQVWYASKDGTPISMFLVHRPDVRRDADRPVLLSGYGGFNISRTPAFDPALTPFLDRGGVFALANLRGGGEYGEDWHRAGMLERKQNVFDDFIAAAEYLMAEGLHQAGPAGHRGGQQRRTARRGGDGPAPRPVRCGDLPRAGRRYAPLSPVHGRPLLDSRIRQRRRSRTVPVPAWIFPRTTTFARERSRIRLCW